MKTSRRIATLVAATACLAGSALGAGTATAGTIGQPFMATTTYVQANTAGADGRWQTVSSLQSGTFVAMSASGTATIAPGTPSGPAGLAGTRCGDFSQQWNPCPMNDAPLGALVGRVNGGAPFLVGSGRSVPGPGVVELAVNDPIRYFADNSGSYRVDMTFYNRVG